MCGRPLSVCAAFDLIVKSSKPSVQTFRHRPHHLTFVKSLGATSFVSVTGLYARTVSCLPTAAIGAYAEVGVITASISLAAVRHVNWWQICLGSRLCTTWLAPTVFLAARTIQCADSSIPRAVRSPHFQASFCMSADKMAGCILHLYNNTVCVLPCAMPVPTTLLFSTATTRGDCR